MKETSPQADSEVENRFLLAHKEQFLRHPYSISCTLLATAYHLLHVPITEWPFSIVFGYLLSFVFVPAFFSQSSEIGNNCFTDSIQDRKKRYSSNSETLNHSSNMGCEDLNRYHPTSPVNTSSPFYRDPFGNLPKHRK